MTDSSAIAGALDRLENLQSALAAISSRTDERRRFDLIDHRRKLAEQMIEMGRVADSFFARLDRPALLQVYRDKFSRMRSAAAMHQASWPAVRLNEADDEYQRSVSAVREANRDFVDWLRATIASVLSGM